MKMTIEKLSEKIMTIEELDKAIEKLEYWDYLFQMADRYTPSEREVMNNNYKELCELRAMRKKLLGD